MVPPSLAGAAGGVSSVAVTVLPPPPPPPHPTMKTGKSNAIKRTQMRDFMRMSKEVKRCSDWGEFIAVSSTA
jgi:hypothetical protein